MAKNTGSLLTYCPSNSQGLDQVEARHGRGPARQAHQGPEPHRRQLLDHQEEPDRHRDPPRCPQERCRPPHRPHPHQQPDHRCHQGLQVQDALRLCPFPHQRQPGQERRDGQLGGRDPVCANGRTPPGLDMLGTGRALLGTRGKGGAMSNLQRG